MTFFIICFLEFIITAAIFFIAGYLKCMGDQAYNERINQDRKSVEIRLKQKQNWEEN